MRIMIAGLAASLALVLTAPAFAQQEMAPPLDKPATSKPKQGTAAYCNSLKTAAKKDACHKRIAQAKSPSAEPKAKTKTTKNKKTTTAPKNDTTASAPPVLSAPAPAPAPAPTSTVAVPPLPHKTI
jgi:hypothetical protein